MLAKLIATTTLTMGLFFTALAGAPKGEAKESKDASAEAAASTVNLIWYPVTYDASHPQGFIPAGTASVYTGDQSGAEALSICPDGTAIDCLRGFNSAPSLPTANGNQGAGQVKTDEQP